MSCLSHQIGPVSANQQLQECFQQTFIVVHCHSRRFAKALNLRPRNVGRFDAADGSVQRAHTAACARQRKHWRQYAL